MRSNLLINEPPLQVLPTLAKTIGLNEAIILQQIHYWLDPRLNKNIFEEKLWVHNTFAQWEQQFTFWSIRTIQRIVNNLEDDGLLISCLTRDFKKTKYYTLDYGRLNHLCPPGCNTHISTNIQTKVPNTLEAMNKQGFCPYRQNDIIESDNLSTSIMTTCRHRERQVDVIENDKLSSFHYTENTNPENTTENTPPPLSPPPQILTQETQEEEEEENQQTNFGLESQYSISDQTLSPATSLAFQTMEEELITQDHQLFKDMIEIWNQTIQIRLNPGQEVRLTDKRKTLLRKFLDHVFSGISQSKNLDVWQNYCNLIAKSRFLLGQNANGFKVTLDWALIPDNAYKVLEGAIYDKPETNKKQQEDLSWEEFSEEIVRSAPSSKYLTQWVKMSISIARFIGQQKYKHWFSRVILYEVTDTSATFLVEGNLTKDIITRQYSSELRCAVQQLYPTVHQLEFKVVSPDGESS